MNIQESNQRIQKAETAVKKVFTAVSFYHNRRIQNKCLEQGEAVKFALTKTTKKGR